jgi:poly [ADP-ribose] polymerase
MKHMSQFIINTSEKLKEKMDLIQNLSDIKIAHKMIKKEKKDVTKRLTVNPYDSNYSQLNCKIENIDAKDKEFALVNEYLVNSSEHRKFTLMRAYKLERDGEDKIFNPNKLTNKKLLWHGSRFSNFVGILSQGLRIAPPEAPKTGYLFGKGCYFADLSSKSSAYCCANLSNNIGLFLLCEVALGTPAVYYDTYEDADTLPKGCHSTACVGRLMPDPKENHTVFKDVVMPKGKTINCPDKNARRTHNEFIVYSTSQVKMRYLLMVKFD